MKTVNINNLSIVEPSSSDEIVVIRNGKLHKARRDRISLVEGASVTLGVGEEFKLGLISSTILHIMITESGAACLFLIGLTTSQSSIIYDQSMLFSNKDEAGKICVYRKEVLKDIYLKNNTSTKYSFLISALLR